MMTSTRRNTSRGIWLCTLLAALASAPSCSGHPQFFRSDRDFSRAGHAIAILPPVNLTSHERAAGLVADALLDSMLTTGEFSVVDPGRVESVVLKHRLRLTDRLPLDVLRRIAADLDIDCVLVGSVNEFRTVSDGQRSVPCIGISMRIVSCNDGHVMWACTHSRRGDDDETLFGVGRIKSIEQLCEKTGYEMTRTLRR